MVAAAPSRRPNATPQASRRASTASRTASALVFALSLLATTPAAANPNESDRVAAQALFEQARQLMAAEKYEDACPKLAESQRLDPAPGTQFNLADCYQKVGRLASAWNLFIEVAVASKAAGRREHEALARERAKALRSQLPRMTIAVPEGSRLRGLSVERCGVSVGAAQWSAPIPVDSGKCVVRATAPGHKPWETTLRIPSEPGDLDPVTIPKLKELPPEPAKRTASTGSGAVSEPPASERSRRWQRYGAYGLAGLGVVSAAVGTFFGLRAVSKKNESQRACDGSVCPDDTSADAREEARTAGNYSTIAFAVAGLSLGGGAALYFTLPTSEAAGVQRSARGPSEGPALGSVGVRGTW